MSRDRTPSPSLSGVASKQLVVRGLLRELLEGSLQGGDRITEATAVERFGVSRTPVREAFLELQGLGLIELRRNCGAVVLSFGPGELRELYAVRLLLEVEAARLATPEISNEDLDRLRDDFAAIRRSGGGDPEWRHDRELHSLVARASGNRRLEAEISRYGDLVQAIREIVGEKTSGIHTTSADEHLAIIEGLASRDPDKAASAMEVHLRQASDSAVEMVKGMRESQL